jgi:prepilin-type N-terminal cleavage/methylation domain-containing protein
MKTFPVRFRRAPRRRGLTLMELVVVMVILVALAGILLPLFPNLLTRAHTSSAATNMTELSKAVQTYYYQALQLPNNLDNLAPLVGQTNPANSLVSLIAVGAGTAAATTGNDIYTAPLAASDLNMLVAAGLTNVLQTTVPTSATALGSWTPTFNPYSTTPIGAGFLPQNLVSATVPGVSTPLAAALPVVYVNGFAAARELALPVAGTYLLFGVGDYSSLSSKVMQEAPVHFDDAAAGEPNVAYCRFALLLQTTADGTYADLSAAKFVGTLDLGDAQLSSAQDHVQGYLNTK